MNLKALQQHLDQQLATIIPDITQRVTERNLIIQHYLGVSLEAAISQPEQPIPEDARYQALLSCLRQRIEQRMPLQYILGEAHFYGLAFQVTPAVLIPRPETELLVDHVLDYCRQHPTQRVLDLGTGSGCIAVALKKHRPDFTVTAVEQSPEALAVARANAERHETDIRFLQGSWFEPVAQEAFDVMVSNPPYIAPEEKAHLSPEVLHEPAAALFTPGAPEQVYIHLLEGARRHLSSNGVMFMELGQGQAATVLRKAVESGWHAQVYPDYAGIARVFQGSLVPGAVLSSPSGLQNQSAQA